MSLAKPRTFTLFDMTINNDSMEEAVERVLCPRKQTSTKTASFVNVNTVNLAKKHTELTDAVNDCDLVFADGSGIRLAAKRKGVELRDNVNGTDLLPVLCEKAALANKKIFLLGAAPGVAEQTANNLEATFANLEIAGTHHGYFDKQNCDRVIELIRHSGADILLVAFGSPIQELWLQENRDRLSVDVALAVGGLFDFYSGRIPRAPQWMRSQGIEWVWRLMQEPKKKFHRYVIGNPAFLWRCFFQLNKVSQ